VATILLSLSVGAVVFSKKKQDPKPRKHATNFKAELVSSAPQVSSKVKGLEIAGVKLINQGTPHAALAVNVVNNSDQPVMSLELTSGDDDDFSSFGVSGFANPDKPDAIIQPHSLKTIEWFLGEVLEGYPLRVSAALFGDGKEEGETRYIEVMRHDRAKAKASREALKTRSAQ